MSGRICTVIMAPSLADAETEAASVNDSDELFGESGPGDTTATAAEIQGGAYMMIRGDHGSIVEAMAATPDSDWDEISQSWDAGNDDAGPETWLPGDVLACMILGMVG